MSDRCEAHRRTRLFARALGAFFCIVAATLAARTTEMGTLLTQFGPDRRWAWTVGAALLLGGSSVIALHQYWRGAAAIIIAVLGWILAVRGVLFLLVPQVYATAADALGAPIGFAFARALFLCLSLAGLYLTFVGWCHGRRGCETRPGTAWNRTRPASIAHHSSAPQRRVEARARPTSTDPTEPRSGCPASGRVHRVESPRSASGVHRSFRR